MARGDSDAPFGVERDDRRSVKRRFHMALCATFFYLLPPYPKLTWWSSRIFQARQALSGTFIRDLSIKSHNNNHVVTTSSEGGFSKAARCHNRRYHDRQVR